MGQGSRPQRDNVKRPSGEGRRSSGGSSRIADTQATSGNRPPRLAADRGGRAPYDCLRLTADIRQNLASTGLRPIDDLRGRELVRRGARLETVRAQNSALSMLNGSLPPSKTDSSASGAAFGCHWEGTGAFENTILLNWGSILNLRPGAGRARRGKTVSP